MIELMDRLVKAWFAYGKTKPPIIDLMELPTGAELIDRPIDPVHDHIEHALRIVGEMCSYDPKVKHAVCLRNRTHGYRAVEGIIETSWRMNEQGSVIDG